MKKIYDENLISIVMRTTGKRPKEIIRALQSVANNTFENVEVILVYQGSDLNQFDYVRKRVEIFDHLSLVVIHNPYDEDRRSQNLNLGWEAANGRYIGFLDDDDTFERNHLACLYDALRSSEHGWVYSQVILIKETADLVVRKKAIPFYRSSFSFSALWFGNFIPIHSFLIDRNRLSPALQVSPFCEDLNRSEDWDFLIRLSFFHQPKRLNIFTCNYHISASDRNANLSLTKNSHSQSENQRAWDLSKELIERRKHELIACSWWAEELLRELGGKYKFDYLSKLKSKISRFLLAKKVC